MPVLESDYVFETDLPVLKHLTYREAHAFTNGFYSGFVWGYRDNTYVREKAYWRVGYMAGTVFRYAGLALLYKKVIKND